MMKYAVIIFMLMGSILWVSCQNVTGVKESDFAIYTLKDSQQSLGDASATGLDEIVIADNPVITIYELHSYKWPNHEMKLVPGVGASLEGMVHPDSADNRHPFVLLAGGERIYMGAFMPAWSSFSPAIPHITLVPNYQDSIITLTIQGRAGKTGDVREDMRIYEALKAAGKLSE